jgi:hypothetical protein
MLSSRLALLAVSCSTAVLTSMSAAPTGAVHAPTDLAPEAMATSDGCQWRESVDCVALEPHRGTRCGKPTSFELDFRNACSYPIKVVTCLQGGTSGKWSCLADGTFDDGMKPGGKNNNYTCNGTGSYEVYAMTLDQFRAKKCKYPREPLPK